VSRRRNSALISDEIVPLTCEHCVKVGTGCREYVSVRKKLFRIVLLLFPFSPPSRNDLNIAEATVWALSKRVQV
jgi:hypothetical protein